MSQYPASRPFSLQNHKLPLGSGCRHMQQTTFGRLRRLPRQEDNPKVETPAGKVLGM